MRILVLNYEYPPLGGGAGPVCRQLCERFVQHDHDVDVVTMGYRGLPRKECLNGVHITRVPALRRKQATCETHEMLSYIVSAFPVVLGRLWSGKYDVIHVHFVIPTGLLAWLVTRLKRVPYVITAHGSDIPGYNPDRFNSEHRLTSPLLRRIIQKSAALTSPSRYLKTLIRQTCGDYAIRHIPNGINVARFDEQEKQNRILMTGRLLPRKGFHLVLEALHGIETDYEIHIAGDGPDRKRLEAMATELKLPVVFHGWLEHDDPVLRDLYETSRIFCLPSSRENASISLLEAMTAGMAVLTTDVSGCPETVGDAGIVVPPEDAAALMAALVPLMNDPDRCDELGQLARERVLELFDWEIIADQYLELLKRVT